MHRIPWSLAELLREPGKCSTAGLVPLKTTDKDFLSRPNVHEKWTNSSVLMTLPVVLIIDTKRYVYSR